MAENNSRLPSDPMILLSFINTKLRDQYSNLDALCSDMEVSKEDICTKLYANGFSYDQSLNRFI